MIDKMPYPRSDRDDILGEVRAMVADPRVDVLAWQDIENIVVQLYRKDMVGVQFTFDTNGQFRNIAFSEWNRRETLNIRSYGEFLDELPTLVSRYFQ